MNEKSYPLTPAVRARLMGALLALIGVGLVLAMVVVSLLRLSPVVMLVLVVAVPVVIFGAAGLLSTKVAMLRIDDAGYRVRFVRGVGVAQGRWVDVHDLSAATILGARCIVMNLRDGRSTTIPVDVIAGDSEELMREFGRRLGATGVKNPPR